MERVISTDPQALSHAVDILKNGGIVAYPTDTAYRLGVDATNQEAVTRLYKLKGAIV